MSDSLEFLESSTSTHASQVDPLEIDARHIRIGGVVGFGGQADVHTGELLDVETNTWRKVAVKQFRLLRNDERRFEAFARELLIWQRLQHENVLPLIGTTEVDIMPALISEWMENGTMASYLRTHEGVDILELVKGVACGLEYLHSRGVVHGDLKGDNVLISNNGQPVLSDFGISRLSFGSVTIIATTRLKGNIRWMAPELIQPDPGLTGHEFHTKASDIWAFGMVVYEVISRKIPYYKLQSEAQVLVAIINRELPIKPRDKSVHGSLLDALWVCCCSCWSYDPRMRPTMLGVRVLLNRHTAEVLVAANKVSGTPAEQPQTGRDAVENWVSPNDIIYSNQARFGSCADVYEGSLFVPEPKKVAVKRLRLILANEPAIENAFAEELVSWAKLHHDNVLPFFGAIAGEAAPTLVLEWMANGTMNEYLSTHEDVDIIGLIKGISCGLEYLHDVDVVHSDMRGNNVLISHDGQPVLSDYGITRLLINSEQYAGSTSLKGYTRWMAPELISTEVDCSLHTKATDVWAFGMVVYEALSGNMPFSRIRFEANVALSILNKTLPNRPGFERARGARFHLLWDCCCKCWDYDPESRMTMREVGDHLASSLRLERTSGVIAECVWVSDSGQLLAMRSDDNGGSISISGTQTMNQHEPGLSMNPDTNEVTSSNSEEHIVTLSCDQMLRKWGNNLESPIIIVQASQEHEDTRLVFQMIDSLRQQETGPKPFSTRRFSRFFGGVKSSGLLKRFNR